MEEIATVIFDASRFLELLLSSPELKVQLKSVQELNRKAVFIVPGHDLRWMVDAAVLSENFAKICFLEVEAANEIGTSMQKKLVAMTGMLAIMDEYGVLLDQIINFSDSVTLFPKSNLDKDVTAKDVENVVNDKGAEGSAFKVEATFSVDTENLDAQVCVIDADHLLTPLQVESAGGSVSNHPAPSVDSFINSTRDGGEMWRETLLIKLRDPFAAPIVKEIKRILRVLAKEILAAEEKSHTVQLFYEDLRKGLVENPVWEEASKEEVDGAIEAIERYVFTKCFDFVYQPADSDDAVQDRLFTEKATKLSETGSFGDLCDGDDKVEPNLEDYEESINALERVYQVEAPIEKLDALTVFVKSAMEKNQEASADLLIPILVWLVLKRVPHSLISDVRYIQRFRNHNKLTGEAAYCLTNIIAIITTIEKLHAEQVAKTEPIYSMLATSRENLPVQTKPSNDFTSSFINTIGFVPRAIGSAVVDTFRSRSGRMSLRPPEGVRAAPTSAISSPAAVTTSQTTEVDLEVKKVRERVQTLDRVDELSLKEVRIILQDYKDLLSRSVNL